MEDKKREDDVVASTVANDDVELRTEAKNITNETNETSGLGSTKKTYSITTYLIAGLIVLIMTLGLIFLLEKQGRINTGLFTEIIADMKAKAPAAKVNGVIIPNGDFESGVKQLMEMAKMQGIDVTDETTLSELRTQAIDTLVNGELLRQNAVEEGMEATQEAIDARFNEISEGVGGKEELDKKMAEFAITEESLRRDIENEILIQSLFDKKVNKDSIEVSDTEIEELYKQIVNGAEDAPTLEKMRDDIVTEIRNQKQQEQIAAYIEELKGKAKIELLI